jgi:hypothetical protein
MELKMERRQFGRRQSTSTAWIKIPGRPRLACRVRDQTSKGALLELTVPAWLPFQFELLIEADHSLHQCEIRHSRPDRLGVFFLDFGHTPMRLRSKNEIDDWMGARRGT